MATEGGDEAAQVALVALGGHPEVIEKLAGLRDVVRGPSQNLPSPSAVRERIGS